MKPKRTVHFLLICSFVLATAGSAVSAQKQQGGIRDSSTSAGVTKSAASKSFMKKSYENKQGADFQNLKFSRGYASSDQCSFETNKGLRCKRKTQPYSRFCRQHDERLATKDKPDKQK